MLSNWLLNTFKIPQLNILKFNRASKNMATKKLADKNIRKLTRMGRAGSSLGITIPKELVTSLGWRERQRVVVKRIKGGMTIKDYRSK